MKLSFYEMLEVSRKATQEEIDAAFKRMTEKLGATTSVRGSAESLTQLNLIRDGYLFLSNPEKRVMYDAKLHATEHGIKLMFFPKDTARRSRSSASTRWRCLRCWPACFTYVLYQKRDCRADAVFAEQTSKQNIESGCAQSGRGKVEVPAKAAGAGRAAGQSCRV